MAHSYVEFFQAVRVVVIPQAQHHFQHLHLEIAVFDDCDPPCLRGVLHPQLYAEAAVCAPAVMIALDPETTTIFLLPPFRMSGHVCIRDFTTPLPHPCGCAGCRPFERLRTQDAA